MEKELLQLEVILTVKDPLAVNISNIIVVIFMADLADHQW